MNEENNPNGNLMAVDKIENGTIQVRKGFSELRATNIVQMDALDGFNTKMYKLEQGLADIKKVFKGD